MSLESTSLETQMFNWWLEKNKPTLSEVRNNKRLRKTMPVGDWNKKQSLIFKFNENKIIPKPIVIDEIVILKHLEKGKTLKELSSLFKTTDDIISIKLDELKNKSFNIMEVNNIIKLEKNVIPTNNVYHNNWDGEKIIKFGVVSDNHLCSKWQQLTYLNYVYDRFEKEGINTVYNTGDIVDGHYKNRPEHIYELMDGKIGADQQTDYVIKAYPRRKNIKTKFILGNHDHTHMKNGGTNIGKKIDREREDMEYLGCSRAIVYLTPNCTMKLQHPLDGAAYAISYSLQKMIDAISGGEKPNILICGHHHKAMYIFYRNIHALEAGTTCAQTPWMEGKKIAAHVGAWIVTIHVTDDGTITKFTPEFIPQYQSITDDF